MLVEQFLERSARLYPEKVALVCGGVRRTYAEIDRSAEQFADGLVRLGVGRGDRVVVQLENSAEAVIAIFGVLKARAVFVPIGRTVKTDKLAYILSDCTARVLVADRRTSQVAMDASMKAGVATVVLVGDTRKDDEPTPDRAIPFESLLLEGPPRTSVIGIDLDLAALIYTSGSTGRPKGVMLSHANIVSAAASISSYLRNSQDDVILDVLPLSFDYGLYQVFLAFGAGARVVLEKTFAYPAVVLDLIVRERVTALPLVPTLAALLLRQDFGDRDFSSLRYLTNTGAVLAPAHIQALRQRWPAVKIFSMYGLTECKRVSYLPPDEIDERPTSVGKPMDNVEVFVADQDGRLHATGSGELVIRGSNVMQGYWRSPDETARVLKPGPLPGQHLLYSGDAFRIDADGYMYFEGRLDDVIKVRGQRVSPREIENVLYELKSLTGAAVVGLDDPVAGSYIKAFVSTHDTTITVQDVLRHCAERLEDFMMPKAIEFVDVLPKTTSGKIDRRSLAESATSTSVS